MKATQFLIMLLALGFQSVVARADHEVPEGSLRALHDAAHQLEYEVQYSYLNYRVKQSVYRFAANVSQFFTCTGGNPADGHETVGSGCYGSLRATQRSFYLVDRYLYDTGYDYPSIYRQYVRVSQLLRSVAGPGLGNGSGTSGGPGTSGEPDPDLIPRRP